MLDLYSLLGVRRSASADEIERAYRRLSRRYHPGVNPGDGRAAETYRQIQDAYGVLGDERRRRDYDRGVAPDDAVVIASAVAFEGFDFSAPAEGPLAATFSELFADVFQDAARRGTTSDRGSALETVFQLSFDDAMRGGQFPLSIVRHDKCSSCGGEGRVSQPMAACNACGGRGALRWARGHMVFTKACESCDGSGRVTTQACRTCGGVGVSPRSEVVTLDIPPGIESGARVVVPGRGHVNARGGIPGDLYVTVEVAPHPFFRREGRDLRITLPVAIHEGALGARVDVPTLEGPVPLRLPPGTSSGQQLRLVGRGVPSASGTDDPVDRGDLIVDVLVVLPPVRDPRSRELLKEFGRLNPGNVRAHLFR